MMYSAVRSSSPVSTNAEKFSNLPWLYGCFSSAGSSETRTDKNVMMAATKSSPECRASDKTPKLPVRMTRKALRETNNRAETTLSSAARFFSFTSSTRRSIITHRDYRSPLSLAAFGTRTFGGPDRWKTPIGFRRRPEERSSSGLTQFETQGCGIYAVAQAGGFGPIGEHMA